MVLSTSFCFCEYIEIKKFLAASDAQLLWNPLAEKGLIISNSTLIQFKLNESLIIFDNKEIEQSPGLIKKNGALYIHQQTVKQIHTYLKKEKIEIPEVAVILIDPGHGGKDPGALFTHTIKDQKITLYEKNLTLQVSLLLYNQLKKRFPEKKIMLTRSTDIYLKLEDRVELANNMEVGKLQAILYISIHFNASFNKNANGFEVWHLPTNYRRKVLDEKNVDEEEKEILPILNTMLEEEYTLESITLAKNILNNLNQEIGEITENRGLKEESWFVVRSAHMPSVLLELGFLTNTDEAIRLTQKKYLNKLSNGIYNGVCDFISHFENTKGFTK